MGSYLAGKLSRLEALRCEETFLMSLSRSITREWPGPEGYL